MNGTLSESHCGLANRDNFSHLLSNDVTQFFKTNQTCSVCWVIEKKKSKAQKYNDKINRLAD